MEYELIIRTPIHKLAAKTSQPTEIPGGNITELPGVKDSWERNRVWMLGDDTGRFAIQGTATELAEYYNCLLYTSPSPRDRS